MRKLIPVFEYPSSTCTAPGRRLLSFLLLLSGLSWTITLNGQSPFVDNTPGSGKTFNVPAGVTSVQVEVWGAGAGANGNNSIGQSGATAPPAAVTAATAVAALLLRATTAPLDLHPAAVAAAQVLIPPR